MCMNCWLLKWFFFCPHSHYSHVTKILHEEHYYYKLLEVFYPPKSVSSSLSFSILFPFLLSPFSSLSSSFCLLGARPSHLRPHTAWWHPRNCKVRSDVKTHDLYFAFSRKKLQSVWLLSLFSACASFSSSFVMLCSFSPCRNLLRFLLYCRYYLRSKCRNFFYYSYSNCQVCRTFLCFSYLHCIYFLFYVPSLSWFLTIIDCIQRTLHSFSVSLSSLSIFSSLLSHSFCLSHSLSLSFKMIKLFLSLYVSVDIRLMKYSRNRQPTPASTGLISLIPCTWPDPEVRTKCVRVSTLRKINILFLWDKKIDILHITLLLPFSLHLLPPYLHLSLSSFIFLPIAFLILIPPLSLSHPLS